MPLPERMQALDKDRRGLPIPFLVVRDPDGGAHFTINDESKRQRCLKENLCAICGQPLHRGRWYVGGSLGAFHEHGRYVDPPLHRECTEYGLQVCPYLAAPKYTGRLDESTYDFERPGPPSRISADRRRRANQGRALVADGPRARHRGRSSHRRRPTLEHAGRSAGPA